MISERPAIIIQVNQWSLLASRLRYAIVSSYAPVDSNADRGLSIVVEWFGGQLLATGQLRTCGGAYPPISEGRFVIPHRRWCPGDGSAAREPEAPDLAGGAACT